MNRPLLQNPHLLRALLLVHGIAAGVHGQKPGTLLWKLHHPVASSPAIGTDGTVYIGSFSGWISTATHKRISNWNRSPLPKSGSSIFALDGKTGAKKWDFKWNRGSRNRSMAPAIGGDGTVYIGTGFTVYALDGKTAEELKPVEPVAEVAKPEPATAKAPAISIHKAIGDGNIEAVKQHIAAGTDVNAKSKFENTPLNLAAFWGHKEIAELLIAKGADRNAKDVNGRTPLHYATFGSNETVELLLANGADVNPKDRGGKTPLDLAIQQKKTETADLIRKHGGKTGEELKAEGK